MSIGIDRNVVNDFDYKLSLKRIKNDLQSDFIYAPHLSVIFYRAADELWERLSSKLRNGTYEPRLPIILDVPKASGFTRPGAILWPYERFMYQVIVDAISPTAEATLDRSRVLSYVLLEDDPKGFMFKPSGECYSEFKEKILSYCKSGNYSHALFADIASYFERLYQHVLINLLNSAGCNVHVVNFLEKILLLFTQKDSHGIVQGVFPSDYLGTFYLCSIDARHEIENIPYVRYVDDIYTFFKSKREALLHKIRLSSWLRPEGLNYNEAKTDIYNIDDLILEETKTDTLFEKAQEEVSDELERGDFYSSTISWDFLYEDILHEEIEEEEIELEATKLLFDQANVLPEKRNNIDRFCLSIFAAVKDEYAIDYVLDQFHLNPHMAQVYAKYLQLFVKDNPTVSKEVENIFYKKDIIYEYQLLWLYALLTLSQKIKSSTVNKAIKHLTNSSFNKILKAASAVFIGKFGNPAQRRLLRNHYQIEASPYVRAAIIYSARHFPRDERETCFSAWSGHDEINSLIVIAAKRMQEIT